MKKKILFIITRSVKGGAQKHLYEIIRFLNRDRYSIDVLCAPGGPLTEQLKEIGINLFLVPQLRNEINPVRDAIAFIKVFKIIRKGKYDIVHCHSTKAGIIGRIAACLAGVPAIIFTAHGFAFREAMFLPKKLLLIFMEKISAMSCHTIITVSEYDRKNAIDLKLKSPDNIITIHNGIDIGLFRDRNDDRYEIRKRFGLYLDHIVVGTVANFYFNKGYKYLILAAKIVLDENPSVRFISVGDGPMRDEIVELTKRLGIEERFIFAGYQQDVIPLLSIMDIFVLSSIKEGFPYSLLEAMAMDKPIVATEVGGVPEVIENYKTGILAESCDHESLAQSILVLTQDPIMRKQIIENAKIRINDFSLQNMVCDIEKLYRVSLDER